MNVLRTGASRVAPASGRWSRRPFCSAPPRDPAVLTAAPASREARRPLAPARSAAQAMARHAGRPSCATASARNFAASAPRSPRQGLAHEARRPFCAAASAETSAAQSATAGPDVSTTLEPLVVVLDMDECLIHSTDFSASPVGLRQHEAARQERVETAGSDIRSFRVQMADSRYFTVLKREGVDEFLDACLQRYETYVFTAGTEAYASPILDVLDPARRLAGRFYRQDCRAVRTAHGDQYLKDLTVVTRRRGQKEVEDLSRLVLVDNNPMSFVCQPRNGILVPHFLGEPDAVLPQVTRLLETLAGEAADVRPVLHSIFGLEKQLAEARRVLLGVSRL